MVVGALGGRGEALLKRACGIFSFFETALLLQHMPFFVSGFILHILLLVLRALD